MSTDPKVTTFEDLAKLRVGEQWGAYWLHADGWMKLHPPAAPDCKLDELRPYGSDETRCDKPIHP